jgi:hypothetical protein
MKILTSIISFFLASSICLGQFNSIKIDSTINEFPFNISSSAKSDTFNLDKTNVFIVKHKKGVIKSILYIQQSEMINEYECYFDNGVITQLNFKKYEDRLTVPHNDEFNLKEFYGIRDSLPVFVDYSIKGLFSKNVSYKSILHSPLDKSPYINGSDNVDPEELQTEFWGFYLTAKWITACADSILLKKNIPEWEFVYWPEIIAYSDSVNQAFESMHKAKLDSCFFLEKDAKQIQDTTLKNLKQLQKREHCYRQLKSKYPKHQQVPEDLWVLNRRILEVSKKIQDGLLRYNQIIVDDLTQKADSCFKKGEYHSARSLYFKVLSYDARNTYAKKFIKLIESEYLDYNNNIVSSSKVDFKRQQEIKDSINLSFIDAYERKLKKCANTSKKWSQQKRSSCYSKIIKVYLDTNVISNDEVLLFTQKLYESAIRKGDDDFNKKKYENAILFYRKSLLVKPFEVYPKDRIEITNQVIEKKKRK